MKNMPRSEATGMTIMHIVMPRNNNQKEEQHMLLNYDAFKTIVQENFLSYMS